MTDSRMEAGIYEMSLEHLVVVENKVLKKKKSHGVDGMLKGHRNQAKEPQCPKLEQFE